MISAHSPWLAAHGKLWYDDKWYRYGWIVWPQALAVAAGAVVLGGALHQQDRAMGEAARQRRPQHQQLTALRDTAKTRQAGDGQAGTAAARGGEMLAQFFMGTLYDPDLKLSTIAQPDVTKAVGWYARGANQGEVSSLRNLVLLYYRGAWVRRDFTRACFYANKLGAGSLQGLGEAMAVKGDCYARGLGDTKVDLVQAATAYEGAYSDGSVRAGAALGYFYENGIGGKAKNGETALKYYREAADKGNSLGLHNLGAAYNSGLFGLQRDGGKSARLIARALENKYDVTVQSLTTHPEFWSSDFWQNLQRRLAEKGLYNGPVDGRATPATLDAVRRLGRS